MKDVKLAFALPAGWTTTGDSTFARVEPGQTVSTKLTVTPGPDVKPASFTLRLDASYTARGASYTNSTVTTAQLPYASVSQAANVVGISDAQTFAKGNFDGAGNSFYGEALAEKGYRPGAKVTVNGAEFTWPSGAPGTPNIVKGMTAPILLSGKGTHLALLGSGSNLTATGSVTVMYTDGTESKHTLQLPNWCCQDAAVGGARLAVPVKGRYTPTGLGNTTTDYRVFYNAVEVTPGKTVRAIRLPSSANLGIFAATLHDKPLPPAPKGEAWVSDLEWIDSTNGWGPVERDRSNNESAPGDGNPITLNGVVYAKGLGAHAPSSVKVNLAGSCTRFTAEVGVDDEMADRGSVTFSVVADGVTKYTSPVLTGTSATVPVDMDVTGAKVLDLVVGDGGNGIGSDHGDWAEATLSCNP